MRQRFNPDLDHRRSIRLPGHDYTRGAAIFVTICAYQRAPAFGSVLDGAVDLSEIGRIVSLCWDAIPAHFAGVGTDAFIIMPNHVHGILVLDGADRAVQVSAGDGALPGAGARRAGARHASPLRNERNDLPRDRPCGAASGSVGSIVGSFKSAAARRINTLRGTPGAPVWQRNYYEHVIRDQNDLDRIREYIAANPASWHTDDLHVPDGARIP